jgi:protease I
MKTGLNERRIAVVATDGFEQSELLEPVAALRGAGATVHVIAPHGGQIQGMAHQEKGEMVAVDRTLDEVEPGAYDALILPGGVANPDTLRITPRAVDFVRAFVVAGKPVAAICHGPWTLIEAGGTAGKRMTSWPSLRTDLANAGAEWVDEPCVRDGSLVTSRNPGDLPAFCKAAIELIRERARKGARLYPPPSDATSQYGNRVL